MLLLDVLQPQRQNRVLGKVSLRFSWLFPYDNLFFCILELIKPSKEQLAMQAELQRLQTVRRVDEEEFNNQKQVLQMQLHSEVSVFTPDV